MNHKRLVVPLSLLAASVLALPAFAGDAKPSVFTQAQAKTGKVAYESTCGICHLNTLRGRVGAPGELPDPDTLPENYRKTINGSGGYVPALIGDEFMAKWGPKTAGEFAERIRQAVLGFPPNGTNDTTYLALAAYILQSNGSRPGKQALTATTGVPVVATLSKAKRQKF
jgi:mono/diheme cytochrome c family protein